MHLFPTFKIKKYKKIVLTCSFAGVRSRTREIYASFLLVQDPDLPCFWWSILIARFPIASLYIHNNVFFRTYNLVNTYVVMSFAWMFIYCVVVLSTMLLLWMNVWICFVFIVVWFFSILPSNLEFMICPCSRSSFLWWVIVQKH